MTESKNPKVFLSHAGEDKDRFVLAFANRLVNNGIDVWLDWWEMLPGDSLVDKIFEEGLKEADAVIIVISKYSVNKPWVREELNASVVKRINKKTKLIPIVIDNVAVPASLNSIIWEPITDLQNYEQSYQRILSAILGISQKPRLGTPPKYAQLRVDDIPGLNETDTLIFKTLCEVSLEKGEANLNKGVFFPPLSELGLSEETIEESLDMLDKGYYIKASNTFGGIIFLVITEFGFESYARVFISDFDDILATVMLLIVNEQVMVNDAIAERLSKPKVLIDYVLDVLKSKGLIKVSKTGGGWVRVFEITTEGKRFVRSL